MRPSQLAQFLLVLVMALEPLPHLQHPPPNLPELNPLSLKSPSLTLRQLLSPLLSPLLLRHLSQHHLS